MGAGGSCGPVSAAKNFPLYLSLSNNKTDVDRTQYQTLFPIWCIAIAPNGKQLAAASSDNKIHLWCLMTYQLLISLSGHADTIWCCQYSPDCQVLASCSSDGTIRLWEVDTGFPISILRAHANWVWHLQFAPNSQNFASAGADTRIFLWDVDQNMPMLGKAAHAKSCNAIAFSPVDSRKLVSVGADLVVCVWSVNWELPSQVCVWIVNWELPSLDLRARLEGHLGNIHTVTLSPQNDSLVATAGEDCVIRIWNLRDLTKETAKDSLTKYVRGYNLEHHMLTGHTETVWRLSFSMCGQILASVSSDMNCRVWNVSAKKSSLNSCFKAHESWVRDAVFSRDNMLLYTCSTDGLVSMWKVPKKFHIKDMQDE